MKNSFDLTSANYGELRERRADLAILPWGATEPHNLHLPYLTDALLSAAVALDAAGLAHEKYGHQCVVLPAMPLGSHNPGQYDLPFCLHFRQETQAAVLGDIVRSLYRQGLRRLLIINGHGGNSFKGMIRDLSFDLPDFQIFAGEWFRGANPKDYFDIVGDHADELETSVMMHYHPEWVDLSTAGEGAARGFSSEGLRNGVAWTPRDWSKVSRDTGVGDPRKATAEKGAAFAQACAESFADLIHHLLTRPLYND